MAATNNPQQTPSFEEDMKATLAQEFEDFIVLRSVPDEKDQHAIERYNAALRRHVFSQYPPGDDELSLSGLPRVHEQTLFNQAWRQLIQTHASKITPEFALPVRRAAGLYDYYPSKLLPQQAFAEPYTLPFKFWQDYPKDSTDMFLVSEVDSGIFYSSISTKKQSVGRTAKAWCGTLITIDPRLHDVTHGQRDLVVWAEGTIQCGYKLEAPPTVLRSAQPEAATVKVNILARLLRYDKQTGQRVTDPDALLAFLAGKTILSKTLVPNVQTQATDPPWSLKPVIGGTYVAETIQPKAFRLDLQHGNPKLLRTDSFYYVAIVCSVDVETNEDAVGANASAKMFLPLVTLGIRPHDPSVVL